MERLGSSGNTSMKRTLPVYGELSCYKPCSQKHSAFHGLTCFFFFFFSIYFKGYSHEQVMILEQQSVIFKALWRDYTRFNLMTRPITTP